MAAGTYEDICEKLDDVALKVFELLDRLMEERIKLNDLMKFGFVDMAKARYSLGNHRVSSLQLDMKEMSALKHIISDECISNGYSFTSYAAMDTTSPFEENTVKAEDGVRKRTSRVRDSDTDIKKLSNKIENIDLDTTASDTSREKAIMGTKNYSQKMHDPLKWFGILTPQSLRNCQKYFQQSIDNIATIASVQNEIKALYNYMNYLKAEKKKWLEQQNQ